MCCTALGILINDKLQSTHQADKVPELNILLVTILKYIKHIDKDTRCGTTRNDCIQYLFKIFFFRRLWLDVFYVISVAKMFRKLSDGVFKPWSDDWTDMLTEKPRHTYRRQTDKYRHSMDTLWIYERTRTYTADETDKTLTRYHLTVALLLRICSYSEIVSWDNTYS